MKIEGEKFFSMYNTPKYSQLSLSNKLQVYKTVYFDLYGDTYWSCGAQPALPM